MKKTHVGIFYPCHCCGKLIDLTLPKNRGFLINKKAAITSQMVIFENAIANSLMKLRYTFQLQLDRLTKELRGLP